MECCQSCGAEFDVDFKEEDFEINFCVYCGNKLELIEMRLMQDVSELQDEDVNTYFIE